MLKVSFEVLLSYSCPACKYKLNSVTFYLKIHTSQVALSFLTPQSLGHVIYDDGRSNLPFFVKSIHNLCQKFNFLMLACEMLISQIFVVVYKVLTLQNVNTVSHDDCP